MKHTLFFTGVLSLLLIVGCDTSSDVAGPPPAPPIMPEMNVGDAWVMRLATIQGEGEEVFSRIDTFQVFEEILIAGEPWFDIRNTGSFSLSNLYYGNLNTTLYAFRESGIWHRLKDDIEILTIKQPLFVGEYDIANGVRGKVARTDTIYSNVDIGTVPVVHYQYRFTSGFRPFRYAETDLEHVQLNEEVTTSSFFSSELGLVRIEALGIFYRDTDTEAIVRQRYIWDLVEYIPASRE